MIHHVFTLSVGVLTCTLIALSVANATDQTFPPDLAQPAAAETRESSSNQCAGLSGMDASGGACEQSGEHLGNAKGL